MRKHILPVVVLLVGLLMARQLYPYVSGTTQKSSWLRTSDLQPWRPHVWYGPTTHLSSATVIEAEEVEIETDERRMLLNALTDRRPPDSRRHDCRSRHSRLRHRRDGLFLLSSWRGSRRQPPDQFR